jgi:Domain of unknown function (DUF1707)
MSDLNVRASDAEREQAVVQLREACAAGRLTLEEFAQRVDEAYAARTQQELERVTRELPPTRAPSRKRPRQFTISIFGGADRRGRWRVAPRCFVLDLFGGADLDLRQAELVEPTATFYVLSVFGGSDFYVPEGIEVDMQGLSVFGGNDEWGGEGHVAPGAPLIRIVAVNVFGGRDVWHVPAGEAGTQGEIRRSLRRAVRS